MINRGDINHNFRLFPDSQTRSLVAVICPLDCQDAQHIIQSRSRRGCLFRRRDPQVITLKDNINRTLLVDILIFPVVNYGPVRIGPGPCRPVIGRDRGPGHHRRPSCRHR